MSVFTPRVTGRSVLAGAAILVVAVGIMFALGADMGSLGLGIVVGFAAVASVALLAGRGGKA
jgi:hypothetical protein